MISAMKTLWTSASGERQGRRVVRMRLTWPFDRLWYSTAGFRRSALAQPSENAGHRLSGVVPHERTDVRAIVIR